MLKTVPFHGTCPPNSELTLVSARISTPFQLQQIAAAFAVNCERLLRLEFFISDDSNAPSAGAPLGLSLLQDYGQEKFIVGDGDTKILSHQVDKPEAGSYLKVYSINSDAFDHAVDVQITIKILPR